MQVRGRLAVQNGPIEAAAQERDLVGKGCEIIGRNADRLAGAGHLLRIAGCGGEAVDPGVLDRSDQLCGAGLVQRRLDRCLVDPRAQLHLPVDRHVRDGASRHGIGRRNDEDRERCGERHGERDSGGSRKCPPRRDPEQAPEPIKRDHAAATLTGAIKRPCSILQSVSTRSATSGSWVATTKVVARRRTWSSITERVA